MWGWFGGGSAAQKRKDSPKNAILDLRAQLEMLKKREKHLMSQIDEQDSLARKHVSSNKNAAKAALRRKKLHESHLDQTLSHIMTLEQQVNSIEAANINRETLAAMEKAGDAMKLIHSNLTPEKVDETMDSIREQNQLSEEIVQAISSASANDTVDEDELQKELDALQQEKINDDMLKSGNIPATLPNAPNGEIRAPANKATAVEDDDDEELAKLQAEMAM